MQWILLLHSFGLLFFVVAVFTNTLLRQCLLIIILHLIVELIAVQSSWIREIAPTIMHRERKIVILHS